MLLAPKINLDIETLLSQILERRKRSIEPMRLTRERLFQLARTLRPALESLRDAAQNSQGTSHEFLSQRIETLTKQLLLADEVAQSVRELESRFQRDRLRLVVMGFSRQGKSRLLQTITGLTSREIPSGCGGDCTDVICEISHYEGTPYAEIDLYSPQSLFEQVIQPFFQVLFPEKTPLSLSDFLQSEIPQVDPQMSEHVGLRLRLVALKEFYSEYSPFLSGARSERITLDQIRDLVAKTDDKGNLTGYKHLAVAEARIFCSFGNHGLKQLSFVDCRGYSAVEPQASARISQIISRDADAVLLVRMPRSTGDDFNRLDRKLHDTIQRALGARQFSDIGFYLINRDSTHSNSQVLCEKMQRDVEPFAADAFVADCTDPETISNAIEPILRHLARNLSEFDQALVEPIQKRVNEVVQVIREEIESGLQFDFDDDFKNDTTKEGRRIKSCLSDLHAELHKAGESMGEFQQALSERVIEQVREMVRKLESDPGVPTLAEFQRSRAQIGTPHSFFYFKHAIRSKISSTLSGIDDSLQSIFSDARDAMKMAFLETGRMSRLGLNQVDQFWQELADAFDCDDHEEKEMAKLIRDNSSNSDRASTYIESKFENCFGPVDKEDLRFTPDRIELKNPKALWNQILKGKGTSIDSYFERRLGSPAELIETLKAAHQAAIESLKSNEVAIADRLFEHTLRRSKRFVDEITNCVHNTVWESFYQRHKTELWPEIYADKAAFRESISMLRTQLKLIAPHVIVQNFSLRA